MIFNENLVLTKLKLTLFHFIHVLFRYSIFLRHFHHFRLTNVSTVEHSQVCDRSCRGKGGWNRADSYSCCYDTDTAYSRGPRRRNISQSVLSQASCSPHQVQVSCSNPANTALMFSPSRKGNVPSEIQTRTVEAVAASLVTPTVSLATATATGSLEWWQLPDKYRRQAIDDLECEAINMGATEKPFC